MSKLEESLARLQERVERRKAGKGTLPPVEYNPPCAAAKAARKPHKMRRDGDAHKPRQYKDED